MAKKMNKGEDNKSFNNIQTCVLKVNIHCDGCQKKVKKLLHKIDGVYTTDIVADQGKVTVVGCVDSATLLKKLNKAGKHAVEWPTKGGNQKNFTNQLQMFQLDNPKDHKKDNGKPQKGGSGGGKDKDKDKDLKGGQQKHQHLEEPQGKGIKDMFPNMKDFKFPVNKNNEKSGKFDVGSEDEDLDGEFDDELSDEFDDEDDVLGDLLGSDEDDEDDDILGDPKLMKAMNGMGLLNDKKGSGGGGGGGHGKKGDQVHVANNSKGGGGKNGGGVVLDNKNGGGKKKGGNSHDGKKGKNEAVQPKMGHGVPGMNHGQMGNMNQMGQFPTVQGLPAGANGMPVGYNGGFVPQDMMRAGAAVGNINPYQQQQYMQAMLQQQQQQRMLMNGQGPYPMPMGDGYGYARPMYGPGVQSSYSMFSDEDPNGCSIM